MQRIALWCLENGFYTLADYQKFCDKNNYLIF